MLGDCSGLLGSSATGPLASPGKWLRSPPLSSSLLPRSALTIWRTQDRDRRAAPNADPLATETFPGMLTRVPSELFQRQRLGWPQLAEQVTDRPDVTQADDAAVPSWAGSSEHRHDG